MKSIYQMTRLNIMNKMCLLNGWSLLYILVALLKNILFNAR